MMDASLKMAKLFEGQNSGSEEDRISSLPDSIIHHILSFLPTKYAVGTSVLARRWEYLWTSLTKHDFNDGLLYSRLKGINDPIVKRSFMNFVDRVLLLSDASRVQKFILTCTIAYDPSRLKTWFSTVIRRNVQELILNFEFNDPFVFPRCLISCDSLTRLEIRSEDNCQLRTPSVICFPNLKVLHLAFVYFCSDHLTQDVLFSFPVLEIFSAEELVWVNINTVNISAPSLKILRIDDYHSFTVQAPQISIYAENLKYMEFSSSLQCKYSIYHRPSRVDPASIDVSCASSTVHCLIELLEGFCNITSLELSDRTIMTLVDEDTITQLPTFSSLVHLTVKIASDEDGFDADLLMILLHKMPNIESLVFCAPYTFEYDEQYSQLESIPQCVLSHIRSVEIGYFNGGEFELCLVKIFLKNATVLEKMTIRSCKELSSDIKKLVEVTKKLLMLPRASTCCEIDFS